MRKREPKDFLDFLAFTALTVFIVAHFLLEDYPNTQFYLGLMILSFICLLAFELKYKSKAFPFRFDRNLDLKKWAWIVAGTVAIYGISAFFAGVSTPSGQFEPTIYVPMFGYSMYYLGGLQFPTYVNDMLFNITLVAPAEELCKLVSTIAIFLLLSRYVSSKQVRTIISVAVPNAFWSVLHVYRNPAYIGNYWFVASAFCSGLILYAILWKTESILATCLSHGFYNSLIIFLIARGFIMLPTP